jgi:hypothetical protein
LRKFLQLAMTLVWEVVKVSPLGARACLKVKCLISVAWDPAVVLGQLWSVRMVDAQKVIFVSVDIGTSKQIVRHPALYRS